MQEKGIKEVRKRGKIYYIDTTINGQRIRRSTGKNNLKDAIKYLFDFKEGYKNKEINKENNFTFDMLVLKFLEEKERTCKEKTIKDYKFLIRNLYKFFSKKFLKDINKFFIKEYENYRILNGCSEPLLRKELILLNVILNYALELDIININPFSGYKFRKRLKDYEARERYLTPIECQKLINNCNYTLKRLIIVLLETGLRINEALNLLFSDIAIDTKYNINYICIRKEISKNNKSRIIPLSKIAMEQINEQRLEFPNSSFIFTTPKGYRYRTTPKKALETAFRKANLEKAGFHILRHTFASLKLQGLAINGQKVQPLRLELISKILGHSNTSITEKVYAKFSNDDILLSIK